MIGALVGLLALSVVSRHRLPPAGARLAWPLLFVTVVALLIPDPARAPSGSRRTLNGARRWVDLGPVNFQPSELARLAVVIWCAMLAAKKGRQVREFKKGVLPFLVGIGGVAMLIFLEPNLSMATLVALLGMVVLFAAGRQDRPLHRARLRRRSCSSSRRSRRRNTGAARLATFLNPGDASDAASMQIHQSLVGIGSGRLFGVGFGQGQQKLFLPYAYSDFLFSTIGEEWGFLGIVLVVVLFGIFLWLGFRIARERARSVRPVPRHRDHGDDRHHGRDAHGGLARADADHRADAAVHVVRPVEPGHLPGSHRDTRQHRPDARATVTGRHPGVSTVLIAGGGTGGHLMPALALASEIRRQRPDLEPVLVGAVRGIESSLLPTRSFRYVLLPAEPLYRRQWWKNLRWPLVAGRLVRSVGALLDRERPVAVLGTGGYASAPVVYLAGRRGIPTAIQEQNAFPGLATRLLSARVRHAYLGAPEARSHLRFGRNVEVFDTGNPITPPDPSSAPAARRRFGLSDSRPVVLVTGGSQGAVALNEATAGWLDAGGASAFIVLWATGRGSYERFRNFHQAPQVQVFDFLDPIADGFAVADLVVGRAGMMTCAELCAWGLPSLLVPLPTAAADHQTHNARALEQAGAARVVLQRDLSPSRLGEEISRLLLQPGDRRTMAQAALARGRPGASADIVSHLLTLFAVASLFRNS